MEIVCYEEKERDEEGEGEGEGRRGGVLAEMAARYEYDRERVVLVSRRAEKDGPEGRTDGIRALYGDWKEWRDEQVVCLGLCGVVQGDCQCGSR